MASAPPYSGAGSNVASGARDLDAERFDPALPASELSTDAPVPPEIARHCQEIGEAEGVVVIHPNWWGQPPAPMKGWIDRVLRAGVAYRFEEGDSGEGVPVGLLRARSAVVFNTSNTGPAREKAVFGDPLETIWRTKRLPGGRRQGPASTRLRESCRSNQPRCQQRADRGDDGAAGRQLRS